MMKLLRQALLVVLSVAAATAILSLSARALSVSPTAIELESSGRNNQTTLRVTNNDATTKPIEFQVFRFDVDENGQSKKTKENGRFTIFPPQAAIAPGKSQSFRIIWTGDANLRSSETYLLSVTELPIAMAKAQSGVNLLYQFSVLLNVSPVNGTHSIGILKTEITTATNVDNVSNTHAAKESGSEITGALPSGRKLPPGRKPMITVENKGNRHAFLIQGTLEISSGSWKQTFVGDQVSEAIGGLGLVQPGKRRRFIVGLPLPASVEGYTARLVVDTKH